LGRGWVRGIQFQRLHAELTKPTTALTELEEEWLELSSELESA
jgi:hypothetical protein